MSFNQFSEQAVTKFTKSVTDKLDRKNKKKHPKGRHTESKIKFLKGIDYKVTPTSTGQNLSITVSRIEGHSPDVLLLWAKYKGLSYRQGPERAAYALSWYIAKTGGVPDFVAIQNRAIRQLVQDFEEYTFNQFLADVENQLDIIKNQLKK